MCSPLTATCFLPGNAQTHRLHAKPPLKLRPTVTSPPVPSSEHAPHAMTVRPPARRRTISPTFSLALLATLATVPAIASTAASES